MNQGNESAIEHVVAAALAHGRAQRWHDAAREFVAALRLDPTHVLALQGLLECALSLVRSGEHAPNEPASHERASGTISFVVCSISPPKLARLRVHVRERMAH